MLENLQSTSEDKSKVLYLVLYSLVLPTLFLGFSTLILPILMPSQEFGLWRYLSIIISFAGITHLGSFDGLYLKWLQQQKIITVVPTVIWLVLSFAILGGLFGSTLYFNFFNGFNVAIFLIIITLCLCAPFYSLSVQFIQTFQSHSFVRNFLPIQGLIFSVLILIFYKITRLSTLTVSLSYLISLVPFIMLLLLRRHQLVNVKGEKFTNLTLNGGIAILISNLGIILLANFDKILISQFYSIAGGFAGYALAGSFGVAALNIGSSVGNLIISRRFLPEKIFKKLPIYFIIYVILTTILSIPLSILVKLIFYKYDIVFLPFLELAFILLFYTAIIFPTFKIRFPNYAAASNYLICIVYTIFFLIIKEYFDILVVSPMIMCGSILLFSFFQLKKIKGGLNFE